MVERTAEGDVQLRGVTAAHICSCAFISLPSSFYLIDALGRANQYF